MTCIEKPSSNLPGKLSGVHLFGFDGAPCSQRVSFALAEKGLARHARVPYLSEKAAHVTAPEGTYIFRPVSLIKHENLTESYAAIHPNMVVPALIHDGILHIESMDIISYLDEAFPGDPLIPIDAERAALCSELIEAGKALHVSVRHVTFNWSLGKMARTDDATLERLRRLEHNGSPEQLADFYARFNASAIPADTFTAHLNALETGYAQMDARLRESGDPYLTGTSFSAADIIWAIKVLRLTECDYPFARNFPHLAAWFARVRQRPGFKQGVMANHRLFHTLFRAKARIERWLGQGIERDSQMNRTAA